MATPPRRSPFTQSRIVTIPVHWECPTMQFGEKRKKAPKKDDHVTSNLLLAVVSIGVRAATVSVVDGAEGRVVELLERENDQSVMLCSAPRPSTKANMMKSQKIKSQQLDGSRFEGTCTSECRTMRRQRGGEEAGRMELTVPQKSWPEPWPSNSPEP